MNEVKGSPSKTLPMSVKLPSNIQASLMSEVDAILISFSAPKDMKQKFSEEVSNLVQDKAFIPELSDRIGEPSELETEDEFIERSSNVLRRMLYAKFGISS